MSWNKQSFITGTMILLAAGIVNRLLGFVPRIVLPRVIGAEGVGLYQMGYPFLIVVLTLITGGVPLAVAKLVAEAESNNDEERIRNILSVALKLVGALSVLFTVACVFGARFIADHLLTDERVYYTFLAMCPIIPIASLASVFRGYFQGRLNMIPTALSQVVETTVRIAAMLAIAGLLIPYGIEWASAGAMAGVVLGELCGILTLLFHYAKSKRSSSAASDRPLQPRPARRNGHLRKIVSISLPVTASRLVGSASYMLESIFITQSLAVAGVATAAATAQYGILQGMVIPVLLLPGALTYSLAVSLVPSLSEAAARNDMATIHKRLHQSLRLALVTGAPFVVVMYVLAEPLCYYMYGNAEVGKMLKMMAPVALFIYFQNPLQATLQALDRPGTALANTFVGASVKLILISLLASRPDWGILGAVVAINVNIALVTLLHWNSVARHLNFSMRFSDFFKTAVAMAIMACICYVLMNEPWSASPFVRFVVSCAAGGFVYLAAIVALKLVDRNDMTRIPIVGKKWFKWM
jgi:stage V sporulation protein B